MFQEKQLFHQTQWEVQSRHKSVIQFLTSEKIYESKNRFTSLKNFENDMSGNESLPHIQSYQADLNANKSGHGDLHLTLFPTAPVNEICRGE